MSDDLLLQAQSDQSKPSIPYSLNEKSTVLLDNTIMDEPSNKLEKD